MAYILGVLTDRRGNALPGETVFARETGAPAGDYATDVTDSHGNYTLSVSNTATRYDIYINNEEGGVNGPNYVGTRMSSGNAVTTFTLYTDSGWLVEHYGVVHAGEHKAINADSLTLRALGSIKSTSVFHEFRLGDNARKLRFDYASASGIIWIRTQPSDGDTEMNIGLANKYDSDVAYFYFGTTSYYVASSGSFILNAGTFAGNIIANGTFEFNDSVTFDSGSIPQLSSYIAPTLDVELTPKKYVDDTITTAVTTAFGTQRPPATVLKMVSDADMSGAPPGAPNTGDAYVANNWGVPYADDNIYEWDGASWVDLGALEDEDYVIITDSGADGSFTGYEAYIAQYDLVGDAWTFTEPENRWVVLIDDPDSYYYNNNYTWNDTTSSWNQSSGPQNITAGDACELAVNVLNVKTDDVTIKTNGSNELQVIAFRYIAQAAEPTPDLGEAVFWNDTDDHTVYIIFNDPSEGVVKVQLT